VCEEDHSAQHIPKRNNDETGSSHPKQIREEHRTTPPEQRFGRDRVNEPLKSTSKTDRRRETGNRVRCIILDFRTDGDAGATVAIVSDGEGRSG